MPQKYYTTQSRYVDGKFVTASPDFPVLVSFPDNFKINKDDKTLVPYAKGEPASPKEDGVVPHFAKIDRGVPKDIKANDGKRPSDQDPA